jgi:uncharacterized protein (DUF58 family)
VTTTPTARAYAFATVGFAGIALGAGLNSPKLIAIGAPFLVLLVVGLAAPRPGGLTLTVGPDQLRSLEGERFELVVDVATTHRIPRLEIRFGLAAPLTVVGVSESAVVVSRDSVRVSVQGPTEIVVEVLCERWGIHELRGVSGFTMGPFGVVQHRLSAEGSPSIKVFPIDQTARRLLEPIETQLAYGDLVSSQRGAGLEFADLREMQYGDDPRHINWRATARSRGLWINDRHPERNSDVVLFIDTFPEARRGVEPTLDLGIRAIAGLARMHLRRHDRVGLITYGEPVRWLQPGTGGRQRYRILDLLMSARLSRHLYWRDISAVPPQVLPSKALIVAVTPLLDERVVGAVADLHGRGFDVAVVEIQAERFLAGADGETDAIARRIWELRRDQVRRRFTRNGVALAVWDPEEPFERPLMEVEAFRRQQARSRA